MAKPSPREQIRLRVTFSPDVALGPGKADLLEGIRDTGSISAAGRRMKMSYRRAWELIDAMNRSFKQPVVSTSKGGSGGGGGELTAMGEDVLELYRRMQDACACAARDELAALRRRLR